MSAVSSARTTIHWRSLRHPCALGQESNPLHEVVALRNESVSLVSGNVHLSAYLVFALRFFYSTRIGAVAVDNFMLFADRPEKPSPEGAGRCR